MRKKRTEGEIIAALERWLKRIENPDHIMLGVSQKSYTFKEILQEVKNKTEIGKKILTTLKKMAKSHDRDIIELIESMK